MRVAKVLAVVVFVLLVEGVLWVIWIATGASTEACNRGDDIWLCDDGVAQSVVAALIGWPIAALLAGLVVMTARRARRHRNSD